MFETGALVDKYRILHKLGSGGMGAVYAAEHVILHRRAAIKVLHPHAAQHAEIAQRFINEAIAAAKLAHKNIVGVHDCGQLANGQWYLALEYLDGEALADFLSRQQGRPIELSLILRIVAEAGAGLHAAHTCSSGAIVHRDIKPDNLFLAVVDDPAVGGFKVVVLDFGIAKLGELAGGLKTRDHAVMGTPPYMAPEQLHDSSTVDPRSDVYALGCIVFEMATGRRPWGDETKPNAIYHQQMTSPAPDPSAYRPDLPRAFTSAVRIALAPDPRHRWPSIRAFLQALAFATPRTEWKEGIDILREFAPQLGTLTEEDKTVGRKLLSVLDGASPGALQPGAVPVLAHTPLTVSDGIPRGAGASPVAAPSGSPGTAPLPAVVVTTVGSASGQSVAPSVTARSRHPLWIAASVAAIGGIVVAVLVTRGNDGSGDGASHPAVSADAGARFDAVAPTTALAIITEPSGAEVFLDGAAKGRAPVNLTVQVGAQVEIRAELAGYVAAGQSVQVGDAPGAVRLTLAPVATVTPDAGEPAAIDASVRSASPKPDRPHRKRGDKDPPTSGADSGSGSTFSPDDVVGD